ncbi:MAG: DUF3078 domain-containing protein [Muribaculaceae bacterium]|nr:DUF3078 domain-containing protein [Muribaculaceae bacterium]
MKSKLTLITAFLLSLSAAYIQAQSLEPAKLPTEVPLETTVDLDTAYCDICKPLLCDIPLTSTYPISTMMGPKVFTGYHGYIEISADTLKRPNDVSKHLWVKNISEETPDVFEEVQDPQPFGPFEWTYMSPEWLRESRRNNKRQRDILYRMMITHPECISYAYWDLPEPPVLPEEDHSLRGFLRRINVPDIEIKPTLKVGELGPRTNWLHTVNLLLQLSQAYVSGNWYQGGNSHLAFLGGFLWDVQLNPVYYPNAMFQSTFSYKISVNSTPEDQYHKYNVSQDIFQYNLKTGFKAYHNWFYSFTTQFKTQLVNSYPANSQTKKASFLSPAELNAGIGMTYSKENSAKTLKLSASIAPISYNLKTCIDRKIDPTQFGIKPGRRWLNEFGSNAEINFYAKFWGNVTYTTRLFLFTDYKNFQSDWENTLNFQFSSIFSTQIYAHLRYDTATDKKLSPAWGKLMMKEILSVGISYNFSTKQ